MRIVSAIFIGVVCSFLLTPIGGVIIAGVYILLTTPKKLTKEDIEAKEKFDKMTFSKRRKFNRK